MKKQDENQIHNTKVYTQPVSLMLFFKYVQRLSFCFIYLTLPCIKYIYIYIYIGISIKGCPLISAALSTLRTLRSE